MAGTYGREMERLDDAEIMAVALDALSGAFGASIAKRVVKTLRTHWASDPFTLGGYSHARPGRADSRRVFSEPVGTGSCWRASTARSHSIRLSTARIFRGSRRRRGR